MQILLAVVLLISFTFGARAGSAVCRDISGQVVDEADGEARWQDDSFNNKALLTYTWDASTGSARLVSKDDTKVGGEMKTQSGLSFEYDANVTVIIRLPHATWLHTLYPETGKLLVTQHTNLGPLAPQKLSGLMMVGQCQFGS
jgi:hypothetical protein